MIESFTTSSLARFDRLCALIGARGEGISSLELRDAGALAREFDAEDPDCSRIARLAEALGLSEEELEGVVGA